MTKLNMKLIKITSNNLKFLDSAAFLFNEYRKFYNQESDIEKAKAFLTDRIKNDESKIFLSLDESNNATGFMQIYPGFSSVGIRKIYILNDLFVDEKYRNKGIGKFLINSAKNFAKENGVTKITLTTAKTNEAAQHLYESENYIRDSDYFVYNLEIKI